MMDCTHGADHTLSRKRKKLELKKAMKVLYWIHILLKLIGNERIILKFQSPGRFDIFILMQNDTGYNTAFKDKQWHHGVVVIATAQVHSTKPELRFCTGSNPARSVLEIRDGEDL